MTNTLVQNATRVSATFREAIMHFPIVSAVFDHHGQVARTESRRMSMGPMPAPAATGPQRAVYPLFFRTAMILALTLGFTLGATLLWTRVLGMPNGWGFRWWYPHVQMHGLVQVFGFIGLVIIGVALHVVPRLAGIPSVSRRRALGIYGAMLAGLTLRILSFAPAHLFGFDGAAGLLAIAGAVFLLAGMGMFAAALLPALWRTRRPADAFAGYLGAATVWGVIGALGHLAQTVYLAISGQPTVPDAYNEPVLHIQVVGFAVMFVLAISLRVAPLFLNIAPPARRAAVAAFWLITTGLVVRLAGSGITALAALPDADIVTRLGTLIEAAGLITFAVALAPWRTARVPLSSPGGYVGYVKFIRAAYIWLVIAALLEAGLAVRALAGTAPLYLEISSARHAIALGFLTLMVTGMALRMLPAFGGTLLAWPRLADASFWLVLASVSLRAPLNLSSGPWPELAAALNSASGVLGTLGLMCWSAVVWRTLAAADARPRQNGGRSGPDATGPTGRGELVTLVSLAGATRKQAMPETVAPAEEGGRMTTAMSADEPGPEVSSVTEEMVRDALRTCYDPEIPVNIVDLGLVYDVTIKGMAVSVTIGLTSPACPLSNQLKESAVAALRQLPSAEEPEVRIVNDPPWSTERMTEAARKQLGWPAPPPRNAKPMALHF